MVTATRQSIKLGNNEHTVDSFTHLSLELWHHKETIETSFSYKLAPHPTTLWQQMKKAKKSVLKTKLQVMPEIQNGQLPKVVILDGCALYLGQLHQKVSTFIKMQQLLVLSKIETTAIFADRYHTT